MPANRTAIQRHASKRWRILRQPCLKNLYGIIATKVLLHCNIFRLRFVAEEDSDSEYRVRPRPERRALSDKDRCSHSSNLASGSDRHRTRTDRCVDVPFGLRAHPANRVCNALGTTDYSMLSFARQPPITKMMLRLAESTA